ncbi:hypothetical protein PG984_005711 [Apiospora sp. TS-2023a]
MHSDSYEPVSPEESNPVVDHAKHPQDVDYKAVPEFDQHTSHIGDGTYQSSQEQGTTYYQSFHPWYREILACILIIGAPLAMMGTLYAHAGQVAPEWPLKITVNALLSIYSVIFRAALGFVAASCIGQLQWTWFRSERPLYDVVRFVEASQGAWGSLCWLYTHHLRQPLTALGAVILVLTIALDPFVQQLVRPVDCVISTEEIATLPRAIYPDLRLGGTNVVDDREFASAMERAAVAPDTGIEARCRTGNCTFHEEFATVGYCSRCEDSSAELIVTVGCLPDIHKKTARVPDDCLEQHDYIAETILPYPENLNVTYRELDATRQAVEGSDGSRDGAELFKMYFFFNNETTNYDIRPGWMVVRMIAGKTPMSEDHLDLLTGDEIQGCDAPTAANDWRCRGYGAATCIISPCVRVYNATMANGQLTENLLSDSSSCKECQKAPGRLGLLDTHCVTHDDRQLLKTLGYTIDPAERWLPFNATTGEAWQKHSLNALAENLLRRKCLYRTDWDNQEVNIDLLVYMIGVVRGVGGDVPGSFRGELIPKGLYNSGNIDMNHINGFFGNISESLTRFLRNRNDQRYPADVMGEVNRMPRGAVDLDHVSSSHRPDDHNVARTGRFQVTCSPGACVEGIAISLDPP